MKDQDQSLYRVGPLLLARGAAVLGTAAVLLTLLPALRMVLAAFWQDGPTLRHLIAVYSHTDRLWVLSRNTAVTSCLTVGLVLPPATLIGFLLCRCRLPGQRLLLALVLVTATLPIYVVTTSWVALLGSGVWFNLQAWWIKSVLAALVHGTALLPAAALLCGAAFFFGNRTLEEQGLLDSSWPQVFRRIALPQAAWGIAAVGVFVLLLAASDLTVTDTVRLRTFAEESYTQFQAPDLVDSGESAGAVMSQRSAAVGLPMLVIFGLILCVLQRHLRLFGQATVRVEARAMQRIPVGAWGRPVAALLFIGFAALLAVPLTVLLRAVGNYRNLVNAWQATAPEVGTTFGLALVAATLCVLLAVFLVEVSRRHRLWVLGGIVLLLALPAPLLGVGVKLVFNNRLLGWFHDSAAVVVFTWIVRILPFAFLLVLPFIRGIPPALRAAARLDGATWLDIQWHIVLPQSWRILLTAWLLCLILAVGELGASVLVVPPGCALLTARFFSLIHFGVYADAAGLCLFAMALTVIPGILLTLILSRWLGPRTC